MLAIARDRLLSAPNLVVTPHLGSSTEQTRIAMAALAVDNVIAALSGERPRNLVNPEAWDAWATRPAISAVTRGVRS
ncbi:Glyoxylate/hydroxypyruvate reductase B [compost metagenome]